MLLFSSTSLSFKERIFAVFFYEFSFLSFSRLIYLISAVPVMLPGKLITPSKATLTALHSVLIDVIIRLCLSFCVTKVNYIQTILSLSNDLYFPFPRRQSTAYLPLKLLHRLRIHHYITTTTKIVRLQPTHQEGKQKLVS